MKLKITEKENENEKRILGLTRKLNHSLFHDFSFNIDLD